MNYLFPREKHYRFLEIYKRGREGIQLLIELDWRDSRTYRGWLDRYDVIYECPRCDWVGRLVHTAMPDDDLVPTSVVKYYCPTCAKNVEEEYKRFCSACGKRFKERHYQSNHRLCPDCRKGDLAIESKRLSYNLARAIEAGTPATLTLSEWLETLDYFNWQCAYCGGEYYLMEHFIPISEGGGTTKDNCVPGCSTCNRRKAPNSCMPESKLSPVAKYLRSCVL